jgi:L-fucose isomerase-like protein
MTFSRKSYNEHVIETQIRQARKITKANLKPGHEKNKDWETKHPDWQRDAQQGNYKMLEKKIRENSQKVQDSFINQQEKRNAKRTRIQ